MSIILFNKKAFQLDAYRPLVDRGGMLLLAGGGGAMLEGGGAILSKGVPSLGVLSLAIGCHP